LRLKGRGETGRVFLGWAAPSVQFKKKDLYIKLRDRLGGTAPGKVEEGARGAEPGPVHIPLKPSAEWKDILGKEEGRFWSPLECPLSDADPQGKRLIPYVRKGKHCPTITRKEFRCGYIQP